MQVSGSASLSVNERCILPCTWLDLLDPAGSLACSIVGMLAKSCYWQHRTWTNIRFDRNSWVDMFIILRPSCHSPLLWSWNPIRLRAAFTAQAVRWQSGNGSAKVTRHACPELQLNPPRKIKWDKARRNAMCSGKEMNRIIHGRSLPPCGFPKCTGGWLFLSIRRGEPDGEK